MALEFSQESGEMKNLWTQSRNRNWFEDSLPVCWQTRDVAGSFFAASFSFNWSSNWILPWSSFKTPLNVGIRWNFEAGDSLVLNPFIYWSLSACTWRHTPRTSWQHDVPSSQPFSLKNFLSSVLLHVLLTWIKSTRRQVCWKGRRSLTLSPV